MSHYQSLTVPTKNGDAASATQSQYMSALLPLYRWLSNLQVSDVGGSAYPIDSSEVSPTDTPLVGARLPYDLGGIYDHLDGCVPGEHYATTFFGLFSAIMYQLTGKPGYLGRAKAGMQFHMRTAPDEYAFSDWDYHWDFNNLAFVETYRMLGSELTAELRGDCISTIASWKSNSNQATNWIAMRALAYLLRYGLLRRPLDYLRYRKHLWTVRRRQLADGCFEDVPGQSRPIQYHAYVLALLHRIWMITSDARVREAFLRGVEYLCHWVDPVGDFNYTGRGQRQLFGYACAIYALEAAKNLMPEGAEQFEAHRRRVWRFVMAHQQPDGHLPLILTQRADQTRMGWYDYHHLSVYNACFGAWVALAAQVAHLDCEPKHCESATFTFLKPSNCLIVRMPQYFAVFGQTGDDSPYLSDTGPSFQHLLIEPDGLLFSCPGGPSPAGRYGQRHGTLLAGANSFGPVARLSSGQWLSCHEATGRLSRISRDTYAAALDFGYFLIDQVLVFRSDSITCSGQIRGLATEDIAELRVLNLPMQEGWRCICDSTHEAVLLSNSARLRVVVSGDLGPLQMRETVPSACGPAQILSSELPKRQLDSGQAHQFTIELNIGNTPCSRQ